MAKVSAFPSTPRLRAVAVCLAALVLAGCATPTARRSASRTLLHRWVDPAPHAKPSSPDVDGRLRAAERSLQFAHWTEWFTPATAGSAYRDAAVEASRVLGETGDPHLVERAVELHNRAVEHLIRVVQRRRRRDRTLSEAFAEFGVAARSLTPYLDPARLESLTPARDYRVLGMQEKFREPGLGVTLVAGRENDRTNPNDVQDHFFAKKLRGAATALLFEDDEAAPPTLMLVDPFEVQQATVGGRTFALATDRTTSIAAQMERAWLSKARRNGLLRPEVVSEDAGIYMLRPYQPGKIPVVLVHGLNATLASWTQTVNRFENDPEISARYQFWLYLYPTGASIVSSAAHLRRSLQEAMTAFDPPPKDVVLVGHSMGGLLSKMIIQNSGMMLWNSAFAIPFEKVAASAETREVLADRLFYEPQPYVARVVFISTPHGGSRLADFLPGRFTQALIRRPGAFRDALTDVKKQNGREALAPKMRLRRINGVGELGPKDLLLNAIREAPLNSAVPYHSIIPQLGVGSFHLATDGIVPYTSSHLDGAESETITIGVHGSQDNEQATAELKRILHEHLTVVDSAMPPAVEMKVATPPKAMEKVLR